MQSNTHFEKSLCISARLFSISKKNIDLFLIMQTNTITYQQLYSTKLHGHTETSGRLSLKRLEEEGFIQGKQLVNISQIKYYFLTPKGRELLKKLFPEYYTKFLQINWNRRPPNGNQQLIHRINTNDFYFSYIALNKSQPCPWILEHPLPSSYTCETPPRCDGYLKGFHTEYYIEQDNNTQSENVLNKKIEQYVQSGIFSPESFSRLVFCLAFPCQAKSLKKPSFSIYKLMLKFTKLWAHLEEIHGIVLDLQQFLQTLRDSQLAQTITHKEWIAFENICHLHPEMDSLDNALALKKLYLDNSGGSEETLRELDLKYKKRLKSHFSRFYNNTASDILISALHGIPLFAIPNHRLPIYLPYVMSEETNFKTLFFQQLLHNGLNTDGWEYCSPIIFNSKNTNFYFRLGIIHPTYGIIAVEYLTADLSAKPRILHLLKNKTDDETIIILLICDFDDINEFFNEVQNLFSSTSANHILFLFTEAKTFVSDSPAPIYLIKGGIIHSNIIFECDAFDEKLQMIKKEKYYEQ